MKQILPILGLLFLAELAMGQITETLGNINYNGGVITEPTNRDITFVNGKVKRVNGNTYVHNAHTMQFNSDAKWLNDYNIYHSDSIYLPNNTDNFNRVGNNSIEGTNAVLFFDNLNFNIGSGNIMNITNVNSGATFDDYNGQSKGGLTIFRHWNSHNGVTNTNRGFPLEGALVFANAANYTYPSGVTNQSHVNGFVTETIISFDPDVASKQVFTYPVGNGEKAYPLTRDGQFNTPYVSITVGWLDENPGTYPDPTGNGVNFTDANHLPGNNSISSIIPVGFWDWHVEEEFEVNYIVAVFDANQTISVKIPDVTTWMTDPSRLRLMGFVRGANGYNRWEVLGTAGASGVTEGSTLTGIIAAGKQVEAIAIGITTSTLPVEFTAFNTIVRDCNVLVEWKTGMEFNNSHFLVQRSSNGQNFTTISTIQSKGNSSAEQTYRFEDSYPLNGTSYYRITQVDFDGTNTSTSINTVRLNCANQSNKLTVYPNPAVNHLYLNVPKAVSRINILNSAGRVLKQSTPTIRTGIIQVGVENLVAGMYLLQVVYEDQSVEIVRFVK